MRHSIDLAARFQTTLPLSGAQNQDLSQFHTAGVVPADGAVSLNQLLSSASGVVARFFGAQDVVFHDIAKTVDDCQPGQLVVYRVGEDCPLELIATALARGAAGILTSQVLPAPIPQCIASDLDLALAHVSANQLGHPDRRLISIGVTGDAGKTVTSLAIAAVMKDVPSRVAYMTDLSHSDSVTTDAPEQGNLVGVALIESLNEAVDCGAAVAVVELDSESLQAGGYDAVQFDVIVVTGGGKSRPDFGPSPVQCAIERLAPGGVVIASVDDRIAHSLADQSGATLFTYGVNTNATVSLKHVKNEDGCLTGLLRYRNTSAIMQTMLVGGRMTESLAAAAAVGIITENPLTQIAESLGKVRQLPGRCQTVSANDWNVDHQRPRVLIDVAGTPVRAETLLRSIKSDVKQRAGAQLWCVLAVKATDDADTLARYGYVLERIADQIVLTCDTASKPKFLQISHSVLDGVKDCAAMRLVADQTRAISWAIEQAKPNDTVLVLGGIDQSGPQAERRSIENLRGSIEGLLIGEPAPLPAPQLKIFDGT